ncbi:MAG: fluoride efflux transporter CrcB [Chitinophagaceae bacterium]
MKAVFIVAAGSGLGGVMRYLMHLIIYKRYPTIFPLGIFAVNILGCFLIGVFYALAEKQNIISTDTRLFLMTGICGGFTTFSTFSLDNLALLKSGNYYYFFIYAVGSVIVGLLATYLGLLIIKFL